MSGEEIFSRFNVVLWRPGSPGNVGAVARAMKNMGFTRLSIAQPQAYEDPGFFKTESERMAWGAADLLAARREYPTIEEAVADAVLVGGTMDRPPDGHSILAPAEFAAALLSHAEKGPVALLFGKEQTGLTHEALARCQIVGSIPSSDDYSSLNLAQAVLIFLYELRMAALGRSISIENTGGSTTDEDNPPTQGEMEGFYSRLISTLDEIDYFEGTSRGHMVRELRRIFNRALLTRREVRILEGIVHRVNLKRSRG
jgi:tRNA (cytidine32/uridine32-2'-O)-methyltransferase